MTAKHDLVIIGAGPVGALAAHAFARRGARVALIEGSPKAAPRLAGEWIHPTGVEALDRLRAGRLEDQRARAGYGFTVLPDDGSGPIELPFPDGRVALVCEHHGIVASLRARAIGHAGVSYFPGLRTVAITERGVIVERERGGSQHEIHADLIVGADGRSSITARHLGAGDGELLSYMAGVELRDVELPREGFGHVVLGGPGPALLYRIDDDRVRACLDVPLAFGGAARTRQFLWDGFGPVLPPGLREALRRALEAGRVMWAATRYRPRAHYRRGRVIALGDAVGHCHPLTAIGLTQGFLDAEAAASETSPAYPGHRARESYAPELLANGLYQVLRRDDHTSSSLRFAIYDAWRANQALREHSMRLLIGSARRSIDFGTALGQVAATAVAGDVRDLGRSPREVLRRLASFRQWVPWAVASVVPHAVRSAYHAGTTATSPLPGVRATVDDTEHVAVPSPSEESSERIARVYADGLRELHQVAIEAAPERTRAETAPLLHALELASDEPVVREWLRQQRRHLATEVLRTAPRRRTLAELAHLLIAVLDAPAAGRITVGGLDAAVRELVLHQAPDGAFGDPIETALACRALRLARSTDVATIDDALTRAARWLRTRQADDGAQPGADAVADSAAAIEAWIACGVPSTHPVVRRTVRWLVRHQAPHGAWQGPRGEASSLLATARAVCALATASHPFRGACELGVTALADLMTATVLATGQLRDAAHAPLLAEALRAMALSARASQGKLAHGHGHGHGHGLGRAPRASDDAAPSPRPRRARLPATDEDRAFCRQSLEAVSRTFARPIAMLPDELSTAVTCGYLLCRIADTIEDHPALRLPERERLFGVFLDTLDGGDPRHLARAFDAITGEDAELELGRNCARAMRVFASLDSAHQTACRQWVAELTRGMDLYVHRTPGADGIVALTTLADLERYCYFVAGTVGHLLTDLFTPVLDRGLEPALRPYAERFGAGLQMVNILKDVTDDRARGWSYIPRSVCAEQGLEVVDLVAAPHRARAHAAVAPVFGMAREHLDSALRYALAIPAAHPGVRLFCLLPLWMAARTLVHARGNDAMFVPGAAVKIARTEVESLITDVMTQVADDESLARSYQQLWGDTP